jgi:DNA-binding beta-propeller fold protein YncE
MNFSNVYKFGFSLLTIGLLVSNIAKAEAALLVSSFRNNSVLRYNEKTGEFIDTFVPAGSNGLNGPSGIIIGPDKNLYVISIRNKSVLRYNGRTGEFIDAFINNDNELDFAEDLLFGLDGNFYLSSLNLNDQSRNTVRRYDGTTGAFIDNFVERGSGGLFGPLGIDFGNDGNLYVTSVFANQILRYNGTTGEFIDVFAETDDPNLTFADFTFGADGNIYVANPRNNSISRYDGNTGEFIDFFVTSGSGGLDRPVEALFGPDGQLYVNSFNSNSILRYDGVTGDFIDAFVTPGLGGLDGPTSIVFIQDIPEPSMTAAFAVFALTNIGSLLLYKRKQEFSSPSQSSDYGY